MFLEQLEDRVTPTVTVLDLTTAGASGALNGGLFRQFSQSSSGSGSINSFVRISTNSAIEQGYNTDFRPLQFDENNSASFTRAVKLGAIPTVIAGGIGYYEFLLDINQVNSSPGNLLSLDELRFYVTNSTTVHPNLLHAYNSSTHTLQDDAGHTYSPIFDLGNNYIKLNSNLSSGSGVGDMIALIPATSLGFDPNQYVYVYSKLGVQNANTSGFEEWAGGVGQSVQLVGSISGSAFIDANANGKLDTGEPGEAGVTVFLDANNNGNLDPGETTTITAANGSFTFGNVLAGAYHVREVVPTGYTQTASINADFNLAVGQKLTGVAFGNFQNVSIGGTIFTDRTGNGFTADDLALGGVTVNLYRDANGDGTLEVGTDTLVGSRQSAANGSYAFGNNGPGTYFVQEVVPTGSVQTAGPAYYTVKPISGTNISTENFGNFALAGITGTVFQDRTGDGFSPDDPTFNNTNPDFVHVTIQLVLGTAVVQTTTTDNNGNFTLTGVGPGTYTVKELTPNGWYQTAGPVPLVVQSGATTPSVNFDNFLVAKLVNQGVTLDVFTTSAVGGTESAAQPAPGTTNVTFDGVFVGTFVTPSQDIQIFSNANFTIDTTQLTVTPVIIFDQPGDDTYHAGASNTTVYLISGSFDIITLTGGINTLNFSRNSFGVTFDAGLGQGQNQLLDGTSQHVLQVTGVFQRIVGTPFNDTITAALPSFNPSTGVVGLGTTIMSGLGQDRINGTLATIAQEDGAGSSYNEFLGQPGVDELNLAIPILGGSTTDLAGFLASITVNGGASTVNISLLTNATLNGSGSVATENTLTQALDPYAKAALQSALSSFGSGPTALGGFGGSITVPGGFNILNTSVLTSTAIAAGTNSYDQALDTNATQLLQSAIAGFGNSANSLGGFGNLINNLGGFGGSVGVLGGFNTVQTTVFTSAALSGGINTYDQTIDAGAAQVLETAILTIQSDFGNSLGSSGGFGNILNNMGGFGNTVSSSGGFDTIFTSILTDVAVTAGSTTYVQKLDAGSSQVLDQAIASFGNTLTATGGFGNSITNSGGFGNTLTTTGGFNQISLSLVTSATFGGGSNVCIQSLDTNAANILDTAIASFGNTIQNSGGFGTLITNLGGFGNTLTASGGFNQVGTSLLTTVNLAGTNNIYVQSLDQNSAQVLDTAIASFGNTINNSGGFGNTINNSGGFGNTINLSGGFNQVETSVLSQVAIAGANNLYVQTLDANSAAVLDTAIASFGNTLTATGGFGNSLGSSGGFGNTVTIGGGFNTIFTSLATTVDASGGFNVFYQSLDANSIQVLNQALATVAGFGNSIANVGGFGNSLGGSGGYNNAQSGLFATVSLTGGLDNLVEKLTQAEVDLATSALSDAASSGPAAINAAAAAIGLTGTLGDGDDVIVGGLLGFFHTGTGADRLVIEDSSLLGATSITSVVLAYGGSFAAGAGANTFYLVGKSNFGHVAINEPASNRDTIDLSSIQVSGPALDLGTSSEQQVLPGQLWLTLSAPTGFALAIGNGNGTILKAGSQLVTLEGAAPLDGRAANPPAWQGQTQVAFLDFDTYTAGTDHVYTAMERQAILQIIQADYTGFDFQFTLTKPSSGLYTTLFFNKTPVNGEPGGLSDEIDFRNLNPSTTAAIDVNGLLGGPGDPAATSANFVALTADIGAHEFGHSVGLQHGDSFGPISFGLHNPPGVTNYRPAYPGPQAAWETAEHIIASPAAVGSTLFDAAGSTFFGERELIKLSFIEGGTVVNEQGSAHTSIPTSQSLQLVGLQVPNTEPRGFNAGKILSVAAVDVANAALQTDPGTGQTESDYYSFQGRAGDLINIQTMSNALTRITDPVDTELHVYDSAGNLVAYYTGTAQSDDDFETADSSIVDLKLPSDGTYYIQVSAFNPAKTGHYELFIYRFQAGNATPPGGSNDTFVLGSGETTIVGRGGNDTIVDAGATNYVLTDNSLTGTGTASFTGITKAILTGAAGGGTTFDLTGWHQSASVIGQGGNNTLIVSRDANFTLTNSSLTLSDGTQIALQDIQKVILTDGPGDHSFDVGGFTGTATLISGGGHDTVVASRAAVFFTLTDSTLTISNNGVSTDGVYTLVNIGNAVLTGAVSGSTFDVRHWSGTDTLDSLGGPNANYTPRGTNVNTTEGASFTSVAGFLDLGSSVATNYTATIDWGDGGSLPGTSSINGNSVSITGQHSYGEEGTYSIVTTYHQGSLFTVLVASIANVADAPLTSVAASHITGTEGGVFTGTVATFVDPGGSEPLQDYSATIDWGDGGGANSTGTIVDHGNGNFSVTGTHTYLEEGNFTLVVKLTHDQLSPVTANGMAAVADAPLTANKSPVTFNAVEGLPSGAHVVATFTDADPNGTVTDYSGTINWGDGTSSTFNSSAVSLVSGTTFNVTAAHPFSDEGTFVVTVTINDGGGSTVTANNTTCIVTDAPLTAMAASSTIVAYQGIPVLPSPLATFTDANPLGAKSDFSATISWGDGTSSAGIVSTLGAGFAVSGSHAYGAPESFTVLVTINDVGGASATASFTISVAPSIVILDPTAAGALTLQGTVNINLAGGIWVDSNSSSALTAGGNSQLTAAAIDVVGGVSISNNAVVHPAPVTGAVVIPDPLINLPIPIKSGTPVSFSLKKGSATINPGVYSQISVSGVGTSLVLNPGIYIIAGGGFSVANSATVTIGSGTSTDTGKGVLLYNAGTKYPALGGTFGAIDMGSSGSINLTTPTIGVYRDVLIFQERDNSMTLSLGASSVTGLTGTIYAKSALLSLHGSAQLKTPAIVDLLSLNGNGGSGLVAPGSATDSAVPTGYLRSTDLTLFVNDPTHLFTAGELARIHDAASNLDTFLAPYHVTITEVSSAAAANLVVDMSPTSGLGGSADGILGDFSSTGSASEITLIQGWNWYVGKNPAMIGANQFDFQTVVTHELGHALGLGHSADPASVMFENLMPGSARRSLTPGDLVQSGQQLGVQQLPQESRIAVPALMTATASLLLLATTDPTQGFAQPRPDLRTVTRVGGLSASPLAPPLRSDKSPRRVAAGQTPIVDWRFELLPVEPESTLPDGAETWIAGSGPILEPPTANSSLAERASPSQPKATESDALPDGVDGGDSIDLLAGFLAAALFVPSGERRAKKLVDRLFAGWYGQQ